MKENKRNIPQSKTLKLRESTFRVVIASDPHFSRSVHLVQARPAQVEAARAATYRPHQNHCRHCCRSRRRPQLRPLLKHTVSDSLCTAPKTSHVLRKKKNKESGMCCVERKCGVKEKRRGRKVAERREQKGKN
jgi:hypothetical protein